MAFLRDRSVFCIPKTIVTHEERYMIGGICMVTATVGLTGAALQLKSLRQYKNRQRRRPSPNPDIIFYLALSDLIACAGVFALAICLMVLEIPGSRKEGLKIISYIPKHDSVYAPIGTVIEVVTLFGYLASYIWTFSYALDTCFQIYGKECPMIVYHIIAWCIPLELIIIIEAVNWIEYPLTCESGDGSLSRVYLSYTPVMIVMVVNPIIFIITYNKVKQQLRSSGSYTDAHRSALYTCRRKFLWMVIVFTVCWLPNIFSITYFLWNFDKYSHKKSNSDIDIFWYIEAFVNPLQGIFNYFLYRRAFRVTATDTRPEPNALPRVKRVPSPARREKYTPREMSKNRTLQRIIASTSSQDEEAPLLRPGSEAPPKYVYNSRLLGHENIGTSGINVD